MPDTSCPEFALLSQFADGELEAAEANQLSRHVETCELCGSDLKEIKSAQEFERTMLATKRPPFLQPTKPNQCPGQEALYSYTQKLLSPDRKKSVEAHLLTCGLCLHETLDIMRSVASLPTMKLEPVPATLQKQVEAQWKASPGLIRIVIELVQEGVRVLHTYVPDPRIFSLKEVPVYRSSATPGTRVGDPEIKLKLNVPKANISATVKQEQANARIELTLCNKDEHPLKRVPISLRHDGNMIFAKQTDVQGSWTIEHLEPGTYEVSCEEIETKFLLEIRA